MAKISVVNTANEKVKDLTLKDEIWNITPNDIVLKKAIDNSLATLRQGTAKTKTRSEVRGGGKKPWKQKGTGRARQGSRRAPNWVGGGIVFGTTPRTYGFKINKKERVLALKSALTYKYIEKELVVVEDLNMSSMKTKDLTNVMEKLNLKGKILFLTEGENEKLFMASRNLPYAFHIMADEVNVLDLVYADVVVADEAGVKKIEEVIK